MSGLRCPYPRSRGIALCPGLPHGHPRRATVVPRAWCDVLLKHAEGVVKQPTQSRAALCARLRTHDRSPRPHAYDPYTYSYPVTPDTALAIRQRARALRVAYVGVSQCPTASRIALMDAKLLREFANRNWVPWQRPSASIGVDAPRARAQALWQAAQHVHEHARAVRPK